MSLLSPTPTDRATTSPRLHVGLGVTDADRAAAFYAALLDTRPDKERPGYARFTLDAPALVLSLIEARGARPAPRPSHFGLRLETPEAVRAATARLARAGLAPRLEVEVTCCHATQDKVWVHDPDGHAWEVYAVLDDAPEAVTTGCEVPGGACDTGATNDDDPSLEPADACCAPPCCGADA